MKLALFGVLLSARGDFIIKVDFEFGMFRYVSEPAASGGYPKAASLELRLDLAKKISIFGGGYKLISYSTREDCWDDLSAKYMHP